MFTVIGGNIYKTTIIVVQNTNPGYYYPLGTTQWLDLEHRTKSTDRENMTQN